MLIEGDSCFPSRWFFSGFSRPCGRRKKTGCPVLLGTATSAVGALNKRRIFLDEAPARL